MSELRQALTELRPPFSIERFGDGSFRITHDETDSRVATCYLEENALLVCNALNIARAALAQPQEYDDRPEIRKVAFEDGYKAGLHAARVQALPSMGGMGVSACGCSWRETYGVPGSRVEVFCDAHRPAALKAAQPVPLNVAAQEPNRAGDGISSVDPVAAAPSDIEIAKDMLRAVREANGLTCDFDAHKTSSKRPDQKGE